MRLFFIYFIFFTSNVFSQSDWTKIVFSDSINCKQHLSWNLIYEETFDNNTFDIEKWYLRVPWGDPLPPNVLGYNKPENISVNNNILTLIAIQDSSFYPVPWWDANAERVFYPYSSAQMWTKQTYQFGKFEIRCKVPEGVGFNSAFWLYGDCANEIDVFEIGKGNTKKHHVAIHQEMECRNRLSHRQNNSKMFLRDGFRRVDFADDFHIFTVEWDEFTIKVSVDNQRQWIETRYYSVFRQKIKDCDKIKMGTTYLKNPLFPTNPMHVILQLAVVGDTDPFGPSPNSITVFPAKFEVDYIRFYQK